MKAVWYERTGPAPDVLTFGEMPTPVAGSGEVAMNSTIAVYATNGNRNPVIPMRELMERCISLPPLALFALPPSLLAAAQVDISKWLAAGKRIHNIAAQFPLSETAQTHLAVERGDKLGTVIIECAR